jgi:hypothetical protein
MSIQFNRSEYEHQNSVLCDTNPYSPLKDNRDFGGTCWLALSGLHSVISQKTLFNHRRENLVSCVNMKISNLINVANYENVR